MSKQAPERGAERGGVNRISAVSDIGGPDASAPAAAASPRHGLRIQIVGSSWRGRAIVEWDCHEPRQVNVR